MGVGGRGWLSQRSDRSSRAAKIGTRLKACGIHPRHFSEREREGQRAGAVQRNVRTPHLRRFTAPAGLVLVLGSSALALGSGCSRPPPTHSAEVTAASAPVNAAPPPLLTAGPDVAALVAKVK